MRSRLLKHAEVPGLLDPVVSDEQRDQFERDGYLLLPGPYVTADDLAEVGDILAGLFDRFWEIPNFVAHDLGGATVGTAARAPEIEYVTSFAPDLLKTRVCRVFHSVAESLHGGPVCLYFEHAIYKPAHSEAETAWHQDSGYDPSGRRTLTFWIPLQDTDESNGTMRYVPGSHLGGAQEHEHLVGRHGKTLVNPPADHEAAAQKVPAGGAVVHSQHTFHSSGPNLSDAPRRTLILQYAGPLGAKETYKLYMHRNHIWRVRRKMNRQHAKNEAVSA